MRRNNHTFVWWEVSLETITHFFCHLRRVICIKMCCWNHANIPISFYFPFTFSFFSKILLVNETGRGVRAFFKYTLLLHEIVMQSHNVFCNTTDCSCLSVNRSTQYSKLSCKNTKQVFNNAVGSWKALIKNSLLNITVSTRVRLQHIFLHLKGIISHKSIWIIFSFEWHIIW